LSRRRRRSSEASAPPASAGLLSFWGEKTDSLVKMRPELVIIFTVMVIVIVILANSILHSV
jgi:preprotein translocase subunit Sec61beta